MFRDAIVVTHSWSLLLSVIPRYVSLSGTLEFDLMGGYYFSEQSRAIAIVPVAEGHH